MLERLNPDALRRKLKSAQPYCRVVIGSAQTLANDAATLVQWSSEPSPGGSDDWSMHDVTINNSRVYLPFGGRYIFSTSLQWTANATGTRIIYFQITPPVTAQVQFGWDNMFPTGTPTTYQAVTQMYEAVAGSYVEVFALQTSGGNLDLVNASNTLFEVARIS